MTARRKPAARPGSGNADPTVGSFRHNDTRVNIPSGEQHEFLAEEERSPTAVRYRREVTEPELIWQAKTGDDLEVPAVPVYIQERIEPRVIIEELRHAGEPPDELRLFEDFDGVEGFEAIEFYEHEGNWSNRMILGDSLLVMTSLAEKERLRGRVQMIYMDPPYGISFGSNWQVSTRKRTVADGRAGDVIRQPEQVKAFRDTWELGINSYLSYMRDRLTVCRDLLTETGSIFMQIGDANVHLVRSVLDEVFGADCAVVTIVFKKKGSQKSSLLDPVNDYLLWYSKHPRDSSNEAGPKYRQLFESRELNSATLREFSRVELSDGRQFPISAVESPDGSKTDYRKRIESLTNDHPGARLYRSWPITNGGIRANQMDPVVIDGVSFLPGRGQCWRHTSRRTGSGLPGMERLAIAGRLMPTGKSLGFKRYLKDFDYKTISNWWDGLGGASNPVYVVQTNPEIVKRCILMTTDPGDLVLDPTCGAGTTAYVAEQWGRRWITIDTSRVALALARTRLMSAKHPYFILADSEAGADAIARQSNTQPNPGPFSGDIRKGFVYKLVRRVTSGLFANCEAIDACKTAEEAEAAALAEAPSEPLVDQPHEDRKRVRVTGRFTMESLSPHRTLTTSEDADDPDSPDSDAMKPDFEPMILEHLRKAGVENTYADERLSFDRLDTWAGRCVQGEGEFTDAEGVQRRVAVSIGPEHGTVSPELVKEAALEALRGEGCDLLVVLGFAFDSLAGETAKEFGPDGDGFAVAAEERKLGRLRVLLARMNPDLAMGDELLKKTGAGNLFMVFGEPDIEIRSTPADPDDGKDSRLIVEIRGVDVYDPTTGQVRSSSTDDIACWFIDTDYDGQGFRVRHAYFTGAGDPYSQLAKTLHNEISPEAWESLYSTVSRPFPHPTTGRIAVKVINHYGDEVLQVYIP